MTGPSTKNIMTNDYIEETAWLEGVIEELQYRKTTRQVVEEAGDAIIGLLSHVMETGVFDEKDLTEFIRKRQEALDAALTGRDLSEEDQLLVAENKRFWGGVEKLLDLSVFQLEFSDEFLEDEVRSPEIMRVYQTINPVTYLEAIALIIRHLHRQMVSASGFHRMLHPAD